ncbi:hypothetical protein SAMN05192529_1373 [Arachidicoccus rhizosphaerae]|uniref:Uncharacterized protein n=1 Tax=Arachidicoccus rhizosphaerae TaxID=551991 RepID=A0A1H4CUE6_9BACT|nr:hypothetical protein SAMN05192529_1373 [Arachidicoccus rhizosphaerae]
MRNEFLFIPHFFAIINHITYSTAATVFKNTLKIVTFANCFLATFK